MFLRILFFIILMCSSLFATKNILLINSFANNTNWSNGIIRGAESVLSKYPDVSLTVEYMHSEQINSDKYFDILKQLYIERFSKQEFDAVILVNAPAIDFFMKNRKIFFADTPVILAGIEQNQFDIIELYKKQNVNLLVENIDYEKNINLIYSLFPKIELLYYITDGSTSSKINLSKFEKAAANYRDKFKVIRNDKIDVKTFEEDINSLPSNSVILMGSYKIDKDKNYILPERINKHISNIKYPIFCLSDTQIYNSSFIGGFLKSTENMGEKAVEIAIKRMYGISSNVISYTTEVETKPIFNYAQLKLHNIPHEMLPINKTILGTPKSFIEKYSKFVESALIILPLVILLLIFALTNLYLRKRAERELFVQNTFETILLGNIHNIVFWCDSKERIVGCNYSFCKLLKMNADSVYGKSAKDLLPILYPLIKKMTTVDTDEKEMFCKMKDKEYWFQVKQRSFEIQSDNMGVVIILKDITEEKRVEQEKRRTEQFLVQQSKQAEVGEMITSIAHQWKTPLLEISTLSQKMLLKYKKNKINEVAFHSYVDEIMNHVGFMGKTIDDFRDFIKPSTKPTIFELVKVINESIAIIKYTLAYNYIDCVVFDKTQEFLYIEGFQNEFKQTIINIVNNSKDAILSARKRGQEAGKILITISVIDDNAVITIEDDGIGFENDSLLKQVFNPFFSTKNKQEGDGFGLYMSKLIIEDKMGGKIEASNAEKRGAKMTIQLALKNRLGEVK